MLLLSRGAGSPAQPPGCMLLSSLSWDTMIQSPVFLPLGLAWEF